MVKPNIKFDLWRDPYGENAEDVEWPGAFDEVKVEKKYKDGYAEDDEDDIEDEVPTPTSRPTKFIATVMGHIPLTEYTHPSKIFNFWVGHTNFNITEDIFDIIEQVDGVEILDIFTRYRFRIGVGKMFESGKVKRDIRKAVLQHVKQQTPK
jgi:hypothetical protein